jgi:hypothetical protein
VLLLDVRVVVEGRDHRGLHRPGHHQSEVAPHRQELLDDDRVPGDERAAVAGEVGALGQRVHGEDAVERAAVDLRVQHRDGAAPLVVVLPDALEVALVGDQQGSALATPVHDLAEVLHGQHLAGGVRR